ncbi:MAG: hypothetical protein QHC78_04090 [Pigmentiphaga sp.]|uniref:hypothetical protein n=1 Tax=Pigmentiphaga sp. TaxID=1977564 RepID=UPI0029A09B5B|nr:hypothetical protein [Pigmentiphaga sp.]MDX3904854.1 hypothetical protein [Pigmentiphaga sp.]
MQELFSLLLHNAAPDFSSQNTNKNQILNRPHQPFLPTKPAGEHYEKFFHAAEIDVLSWRLTQSSKSMWLQDAGTETPASDATGGLGQKKARSREASG